MRTRPRRLTLVIGVIAVTVAGIGLPTLVDRVVANDRVVTVRPGQTLSEIALHEGVSVARLVDLNNLVDPNRIFAGQRLIVSREPKPAAKATATVTHRVAAGETLSGIAMRYGSSVTAIARANGIADPSYIRVGQVLAIPGASTGTYGSRMPSSMASVVSQRRAVGRMIEREALRQGVSVPLALAVAWQESGWQAGVVSYAGAIGVMQLTPATADWVGTTMLGHRVNLWDPASNIEAGVTLLRHYLHRYGGSRSLALAAYYQGQTAADRHGVYAITRPYIASILELERIFGR